MAMVLISEVETAGDFMGLLARVKSGEEIVIGDGSHAIAVMRPVSLLVSTIAERIAMLPSNSDAVMDDDFARDVEAGIALHREDTLYRGWDD